MNDDNISFPALRDLPPGHLEARKQHLLGEIAREPERPRFSLPTIAPPDRWHSWRGAVVIAGAVAALAGTGVAVAAGLGAFNGLSDPQHPQTGPTVLPPQTATAIQQEGCGIEPNPNGSGTVPVQCVLDSARLLGQVPTLGNVYALSDTRGNLCIAFKEGLESCGLPLSQAHPVSTEEDNTTGGDPVAWGIVMDGVTAVSFQASGQQVTVPVRDNLWYYTGPNSAADYQTIHFADGSSHRLHWDCAPPWPVGHDTPTCGSS